MPLNILITGGAGFVGSHLADELLGHGHHVRVLDNLSPQVHTDSRRPEYLDPDVEMIAGDVRDPMVLSRALKNIDVVFHFAAVVGVGQSMYEVARYSDVNTVGTALLLEQLIKKPVQKLVVASSMSIYGEGVYRSAGGKTYETVERSMQQLKAHQWEPCGPNGEPLTPLPTPESKRPALASIYAQTKFDQERMSLIIGKAYNIPTVALRFWNIYGTRQALSNPYTGVLAIFASRLMNNQPPLINEDGLQTRDFVSVHDVVQACRLAMEVPAANGLVFNVGSGRRYTIREAAEHIARAMGKTDIEPEVTEQYRAGDIRHCYPDLTLAREVLGYRPQYTLENGLGELADWLQTQIAHDRVDEARAELAARGLAV